MYYAVDTFNSFIVGSWLMFQPMMNVLVKTHHEHLRHDGSLNFVLWEEFPHILDLGCRTRRDADMVARRQ